MLGWEKSRISHQVTRMVARALVRRVECDEDLRGSWVELDVAGRRAEQVAAQAFGHEVSQRLAHLDDTRAADLAAELLGIALVSEPGQCDGQLTRIARQAGLDSPPRPLPA